MWPLFLSFSLLFSLALACPTDETLLQFCYCEASINGVLLDCSRSEFASTVAQLQRHKGTIGLVQELIVQNSSIPELPANAFSGMFIKKLDLSGNSIAKIDPLAFGGLENVLQILTIHDNALTSVPTEAISRLNSLLQLDLSKNKIGDLPKEILKGIPKVYDINLSTNEICRIDKDAFFHLKTSLQSLNLGQNCMERVPAPAIRGFQNLLALHLHGNQLKQLDALQFMNLPSLNLINLSQNQISEINNQAFLNVPSLKFFYLADNKIQRITPDLFNQFQKLELLDLSKNQIQVVPSGSFSGMGRLSQLYLTDNQIFDIQPNAFLNSSLVILLLAGNDLTELSNKMFTGMNFLQQLSLKDNKITTIPQNTFYQLPSLVVLDLSGNEVNHLPTATFLAQLNLFLLDLGRNKLTTVPYTALNQRIVTVILQENPLVCTERIHVIQNGVGVFVPESPDQICRGVPEGNPVVPTTPTQLTPQGGHSPIFTSHNPQTAPSFLQGGRTPPVSNFGGLGQQQTPPPQPVFPGQSPIGQGGRGNTGRFTPGQTAFGQPNGQQTRPLNPNNNFGPGAQPASTGNTFNIGGNNPRIVGGIRPAQGNANEPGPTAEATKLSSVGQPFIDPHPLDNGGLLGTGGEENLPGPDDFSGGRIITSNTNPNLRPAIDRLNGQGGNQGGSTSGSDGQLPSAWGNLPPQPSFGGNHGNTPPNQQGTFNVGTGGRVPPTGVSRVPVTAFPGSGNIQPSQNTIPVRTRPLDVANRTDSQNGFNPGRANPWRPGVAPAGPHNSLVPLPGQLPNSPPTGTSFRPPRPGQPPYPVPPNKPDSPIITGTGRNRTLTHSPNIVTVNSGNRVVTPSPNDIRTVPSKKPQPPNADAVNVPTSTDNSKNKQSSMTASTIIAVALTAVILVLVVVFVTLCVVRYRTRKEGLSDASTTSRTSAYVAAQAARINYGVSGAGTIKGGEANNATYGAEYVRASQPAPNAKGANAWLYTAGTYSAAGHAPY